MGQSVKSISAFGTYPRWGYGVKAHESLVCIVAFDLGGERDRAIVLVQVGDAELLRDGAASRGGGGIVLHRATSKLRVLNIALAVTKIGDRLQHIKEREPIVREWRILEQIERWAGTWGDEVLDQSGESEGDGALGVEGEAGGREAEEVAVEAVLLAFLTERGANTADEAGITVLAEDGLDGWERAHDDIGEGGGQADGFVEVGDRD